MNEMLKYYRFQKCFVDMLTEDEQHPDDFITKKQRLKIKKTIKYLEDETLHKKEGLPEKFADAYVMFFPDYEHGSGMIRIKDGSGGLITDLLFASTDGIGTRLGLSYLLRVLTEKSPDFSQGITEAFEAEDKIVKMEEILKKGMTDCEGFGRAVVDFISPNDYYEIRQAGKNIEVALFDLYEGEERKISLKVEDGRLVCNNKLFLDLDLYESDKDDTGIMVGLELKRIDGAVVVF